MPDLDYEQGWLDAYARRNPKHPFHSQPARYRDGYVAGQKNRKATDAKAPAIAAAVAEVRARNPRSS